jgi:hypothetical protein
MARLTVCPQCRHSYEGLEPCPKCHGGLLVTAPRRVADAPGNRSRGGEWQQSPGGRLILGVALTLGLCYGLLQMGMAGLRALGIDAASGALEPLVGFVFFLSLQALALLLGGAFVGAGQGRGMVLGATLGIISSFLLLATMLTGAIAALVQSYSAELLSPQTPIHQMTMYVLPLQHTLLGALGGMIGGSIWRPSAPLLLGPAGSAGRKTVRPKAAPKTVSRWAGPVAWGWVLAGTGVAVAGAYFTPNLVDFILSAAGHQLKVLSQLENQVAYGEVYGLAILLGGGVAGSNRSNGLKQGLCVGLLTAGIMAGAFLRAEAGFTVTVVFPLLSALLLAPVGGWFGSELLPPVLRRLPHRKTWLDD